MPRIQDGECAICGSNRRLTFLAQQTEAFSLRDDGGPVGPESSEDVVICQPCRDEFSPSTAQPAPPPVP